MNRLSMNEVLRYRVPEGALTLWWLGQAGFLIKTPGGKLAVLDPYLTNSCRALGEEVGVDMDRLTPPPLAPADLVDVDLYVMTHSHRDHLDPETIEGYRAAGGAGPYLAPPETIEKLHELGVPADQTTMTWPNKEYRLGDLTLRTTFAIPFGGDDLTHVGYLTRLDDGPCVYFTGDTAYHDLLADSVGEHSPDVLVTVINGAFRNMGPAEAAYLAKQLGVKAVVPCHHDLFPDNCQPPQMLRTNLKIQGIGDRYTPLSTAEAYTFSGGATAR